MSKINVVVKAGALLVNRVGTVGAATGPVSSVQVAAVPAVVIEGEIMLPVGSISSPTRIAANADKNGWEFVDPDSGKGVEMALVVFADGQRAWITLDGIEWPKNEKPKSTADSSFPMWAVGLALVAVAVWAQKQRR